MFLIVNLVMILKGAVKSDGFYHRAYKHRILSSVNPFKVLKELWTIKAPQSVFNVFENYPKEIRLLT